MDDMGYGDLSCYGALDIHTPNIDRLASEGIRFTNFLSSQAVCSASRASIMTGCYANRVGISGALFPGSKVGLASEEMTMAELLKQKNYATGIYGKWHLGDAKQFLPLQQGFDEYLGIPYSNDMWPVTYDGKPADSASNKSKVPQLPLIKNNDKWMEIRTLEDQSTLTERYTTAAEAFIKKNKNKPFFLYLPHSMPHVPINASPAFRGKSKQGLYGDVIQEIDASVGRILKTIKENGLFSTVDLIVPVPIHPKKKFVRGYNQSEQLAIGLSDYLSIPYSNQFIHKMNHTESQTKKGRFARWDNVAQNFTLQNNQTEPKHVLLIDDVITTGATLEALVRVIHEKKPELRISIVSLAITK